MGEKSIYRMRRVKLEVSLSRSSIYALIARDEFPKPIPLGARAVGWLSTDINAWIEERAKLRQAAGQHATASNRNGSDLPAEDIGGGLNVARAAKSRKKQSILIVEGNEE